MTEANKTTLHFSQSNLQDFKECPRRFQLKVINQLSWPAAYLEPLSHLEHATELGNKFHQICHQYFSGIDPISLEKSISNPDLRIMWESFFDFAKNIQPDDRFSELILTTPFLGHQLIAKYDLVLRTAEGKTIIYDWKTAKRKPSRSVLSQRYQTFLYPYIFAKAGLSLFDIEELSPDEINMNYWYPLSSEPEENFPYSDHLYSENTKELTETILNIDRLMESEIGFPLTEDLENCSKCIYRSYCERGDRAAEIDIFTEIDQEDLSDVHFELDDIKEIEF